MSMFDTITGFKVECPKCHNIIKEGFQTKSFLCRNLFIDIEEFEQISNKWNDGFYKAYCHCLNCNSSYDLFYEYSTQHKYCLCEYNDEYEIINEYKRIDVIEKVFTFS